jgi:hypothetical protein
MREAEPLEPELVAALEAIDATLAGEPVDPDLAELAELSLILRAEAPVADPAFLNRLDGRVRARFAAPSTRPSRSRRVWGGAGALAAGLAVIVVLLVVQPWSGSPSVHPGVIPESGVTNSSAGAASSSGASSTASAASGTVSRAAPGTSAASAPAAPAPHPPAAPGRQLAQSARLTLQARAGDIDQVAQGVFDVVGAERGSVSSSHVTSEAHGASYASFVLRVPSEHLEAALDRLSHLARARVLSREDASSDITAQIGGAGTRLADARALRRSLLHQLAAADTTHDIDRIQTQLRRNQATIARDEESLQRLHGRVSDSTIAVDVSAPAPRRRHHPHGSTSSGFTLHTALHDAGRILLVAAGVLLIAFAVLIPLALVVALIAWVWALVLRRRREAVLEL